MNDSTFPLLATKRIVISKDFDFTPETSETTYVTEEEVTYSGPFQNRVDVVEREVTTTTPASSREFTKVKVEFLLKSRENTSISRWFSDTYRNSPDFSEHAEYLKIYFLVLDDSSAAYTAYLQQPENRYRYLKNLPSYLLALTGVAPKHAVSEITFAEVLQNEKFTITPVSDMSSYYEHDIYGELEIDITGLNLETSKQIHLIGFVHMDVDSYVQDKGLDPLPEEPYAIESQGGHMIYDLLLERTESLRIPFYRNSMYLNSEPYYGPLHRHTEENPGPDGYIGWMAGPPGGDMGPKLDVITTRNYKVVSSIYDRQNDESVFGIGLNSSDPAGSTGDPLMSLLNTMIDREQLLDESRRLTEMVRASSYAESKSKNNFMKSSDISATFVNSVASQDIDTGAITNEGSHHASVVGIDYFKLVRDMSNYGDILNFHYYKSNTDLVERFLGSSKILDLTIFRDRVTNNPYSFNDTDSLDYKIYDLDEPSSKLVNTKDDQRIRPLRPGESGISGHLLPASTDLATVREIKLATVEQRSGLLQQVPGYNRFFHIKDYDLFHNINFGKYRYSMKLTLVDGVHKVIKDIMNSLEGAYFNISRFLDEASQPVIKDAQGVYVQGNFDYDLGRFHPSFQNVDNTEMANSVRVAFGPAIELLTGQYPDDLVMHEIECAVNPLVADLDSINFLQVMLRDLIKSMRQILKANGDSSMPEDLKKRGHTFSQSSGFGVKSRFIEVKVKCPDVISALSEGAVVANYSNHQTEDQEGNDVTPDLPNLGLGAYLDRYPRIQDRFINNLLLPSSYSSISFTPYRTVQYQVQPLSIMPVNTDNKIRNTIQLNIAPKIISTYNSYQFAASQTRNNQTIMINNARSQQSVFSSFINKPVSENVYNSFMNAGVVIDTVGTPLSLGNSSTKSNNTSRAKEKLKDAFDQAEKDNCLELSDDLKAAIQNAAYNGVSRAEVVDTAESGYANLNNIIDVIGGAYDRTIELIGALQNASARLTTTPMKVLTEEQKFSGANPDARTIDYGLERYDLYHADGAELRVVTFDGSTLNFTPAQAKSWNMSETLEDTYLLVKAEPTKKEDAIVAVNNGYLLRI